MTTNTDTKKYETLTDFVKSELASYADITKVFTTGDYLTYDYDALQAFKHYEKEINKYVDSIGIALFFEEVTPQLSFFDVDIIKIAAARRAYEIIITGFYFSFEEEDVDMQSTDTIDWSLIGEDDLQ